MSLRLDARHPGDDEAPRPLSPDWKGLVQRCLGLAAVLVGLVFVMRVLPYSERWRPYDVVLPDSPVRGDSGAPSLASTLQLPTNLSQVSSLIQSQGADLEETRTELIGCVSASASLEEELVRLAVPGGVTLGASTDAFAEATWLVNVGACEAAPEGGAPIEVHNLSVTCGLPGAPDAIVHSKITLVGEDASPELLEERQWRADWAVPYQAETAERVAAVPPRACQPWSMALDRLPGDGTGLAQHEAAMVRDGWLLWHVQEDPARADTEMRVFRRGQELCLLTLYPEGDETMLLTFLQTSAEGT